MFYASMRLSLAFCLLLTQHIVKQQGMLETAQMVTFYIFPNRPQMVVQNLFETVRKSFSMASPNSSHARSATVIVPQAKNGPIGLLLQLDSIPHRRCPPVGVGVAAMTGTNHLAATAPVGRLVSMSPASPETWMKLSWR